MKSIWREILMAIFMGMLLPGIVLSFGVEKRKPEQPVNETMPSAIPEETNADLQMNLNLADGSVQKMNMDDYLVGVVLAEMPGDFEVEAQKAQAVAARTFTLKAAVTGGKHGDGSVCSASSCCQAYIAEADYLSKGGTQAVIDRVRSAVAETSGFVLTYEGELIEATYFSCSGGSTEDAAAVWGTDFPYLRATDSPGEENAEHYTDTVTFEAREFADHLGIIPSGAPSEWIGMATYTAGDGINTMYICGKEFKGTELRSLLGLRSTNFTIDVDGNTVVVTTKGFGHRVGMSQYGADAMAVQGYTYDQILAHYYQGTTLQRWEN